MYTEIRLHYPNIIENKIGYLKRITFQHIYIHNSLLLNKYRPYLCIH